MRSRLRHDNETDREPISTSARYRRSAKSMPIPNAHRILVIGGGVGGISIARGLLRDGHDVTVFERRPDMRPGGGAVTVWSNGSTVLEQLGVVWTGQVSCCPPCGSRHRLVARWSIST